MRVDWWSLSDAELLHQCDVDRYRASGPGGQKRNKTDSAVRLRHSPTGLIVTATESRSQHENRARAVRRLRQALACDIRQSLLSETPELVRLACAKELRLRAKEESFLPVAAWVLDLLEAKQGRVADVAEQLGVSTARLVAFLRIEPHCWQAAQRIRFAHARSPLR